MGDPTERVSRRAVLGGLGALGLSGFALACTDDPAPPARPSPTTAAPPETLPAVDPGPPVGDDPFVLGVGSGEPDADSILVWTFVERDPAVPVTVEVALDPDFTAIVARHLVERDPGGIGTARRVVDGLGPDVVVHYRFTCDGHRSPTGRSRTAPAPGTVSTDPLVIGHLSCMRRSSGYWSALDDLAAQAPDVVVHCGDYVYEADGGSIRPSDEPPPTTLAGYRALWQRYKVDPSLQAAHAVGPWLCVWDDHEVENNYQGTAAGDPPEGAAFLDQRAAAYRAWWEFTPTRIPAPVDGSPDLVIHRSVDWGALTRFVLLDTRQYRDDQPCDGVRGADLGPRCEASDTVTMLGADQEEWLAEVASGHGARWTTVVQQVVVHQWRFLGGNVLWNLDQWDGYPEARRRLLATLADAPDPVVLTGDVHSSWVADLRADFDDDDSAPVGVEFVGPGVSSDVPSSLRGAGSVIELSSPHIHWSETTRRGWVRHTVSEQGWEAEYRLVDDASVPDSRVTRAGSFTVGDRRLTT